MTVCCVEDKTNQRKRLAISLPAGKPQKNVMVHTSDPSPPQEEKKKDSFAEDILEVGNQQSAVPTMGFRALATQALNAEFNTHKN